MTFKEFETKKNVVFDNIENYKNHRGWIIGNFSPAVFRTNDFETAIFYIKKGEKSPIHWHEKTLEVNVIISGSCLVMSEGIKHKLKAGDIFTFPPKVKSCVEYTSDTVLIVIKSPSNPLDKVYPENKESDEG